MTTVNQSSTAIRDHQQPVYGTYEKGQVFAVMNDVPLTSEGRMPQEQQLMYHNEFTNYQQFNNAQLCAQYQQMHDSSNGNQQAVSNQRTHFDQQQQPLASNSVHTVTQQPLSHSSTYQPHALIPVYQHPVNTIAPLPSSIINTGTPSTPISVQNKRGRMDTSGGSETNAQTNNRHQQSTRIFTSNNTPNKRHRRNVQRRNEVTRRGRITEGQIDNSDVNMQSRTNMRENSGSQHQLSNAACRFAATRYPFSPFSVYFQQQVREKAVMDNLMKYARENHNFELKTLGFRQGRTENNDYRVLIFVENCESFVFLYNRNNWPTTLADSYFTIKRPSIPPQLSLVLPAVPLNIDWDEFVGELKARFPDIAEVIRLRNKAQEPVRAVKLEFLTTTARNELLKEGEISIYYLKLKVVEYFAQANVLICSNCCGIGHFRKNCPQKDETTCKTCGEKCKVIKEHQCSKILKCIHCGESHASNDNKCKIVKDYRAALTRSLLSNTQSEVRTQSMPQTYIQPAGTTTNKWVYNSAVQLGPPNAENIVLKKLDSFMVKVEEEFAAMRQTVGNLKEEILKRYEETKHQSEVLEEKVKAMEKKHDEFFAHILTVTQNICTTLLDPKGSEGDEWKSY